MPDELRPSLWVVTELPIVQGAIPKEFLADVSATGHLVVVEEHVAHGGAGQMLAHALLQQGAAPPKFTHHYATGYLSGTYWLAVFSQTRESVRCRKHPGFPLEASIKGVNSVAGSSEEKIQNLQGPILILGASGFVGANVFRSILACRPDVFGTSSHSTPWRLEGISESQVRVVDLLVNSNLDQIVE